MNFIVLLALMFCSLFPYAAFGDTPQKPEKVRLQLQWKHQFEFAGFYAAQEKGFYKEAGLDVEFSEFDKNMDTIDEVLRGNAQYGLSYSSMIVDYIEGKPVVLIANFFKQSPLVLVTHKDIKTPADLKGKTVMGMFDSSHNITLLTMLDKFGVRKTDIRNVPTTFKLDDFIAGKVDAISVFTTNEIYALNQKGVAFNIFDPVSYGTKFYDQNLFTTQEELKYHPHRVENFRNASIKGWEYALKHKEEIVEIIFKKYNSQGKSKEALMFEAHQIESLILPDIYEVGSIDSQIIKMMADNFIQSGYVAKKFNTDLEQLIYKPKLRYMKLTPEQKGYLKNKKKITMCVDPNWMPLEKIENGVHTGIASEYMNLISQKLDTPIRLIETSTWSESLQKGIRRECDILALAEKTPMRENYFDFTTPYIQMPVVIVTKAGMPFMDNLDEIKHKSLGVVKDYSARDLLQSKYPGINLIEVESIQKGLEQVQQEKLFGFLDNSIVINHEIHKNNLSDLAISGQFQDTFSLSIASRNDEPILHDILEAALLSIDVQSKNEIMNQWANVRFERQIDYQFIWQISLFALIIIGIFIYWNLKLREVIRTKESVQAKLKESEEKFRTLFDIAPVMLDAFDENGRLTLWNKECERVFGWKQEEINASPNVLALFYPDPKLQQAVLNPSSSRSVELFKEWHPLTKSGENVVTKWAKITLPNGEMIHIGYDITQQRKNELEIQETTRQLKIAKQQLQALNNSLEERIKAEIEKNVKQQFILMQQKRLAQMGEMIENIAHQWRQPLAQVNSSVLIIDALLSKHRFQNADVEERLVEIESLTEYMSKTIDDFKNFFNPDKQKKAFHLREAVEQSLAILNGSLDSHYITVEIDIDVKHECRCYLEELQQVVVVIVNNAKDAIVSNKIQDPKIKIKAVKRGDTYVLSICDNAKGIPSGIIDKVFEPYFTTKHKSQGTGVGLYMAKMVVEDGLGGTLSVHNTDEGACFEIVLPRGEH